MPAARQASQDVTTERHLGTTLLFNISEVFLLYRYVKTKNKTFCLKARQDRRLPRPSSSEVRPPAPCVQVGSGHSSVSPQFLVKTQACDQISHLKTLRSQRKRASPFSTGPCHHGQAPVVVCTSAPPEPSQMGSLPWQKAPELTHGPATRIELPRHPDPRSPSPGAAENQVYCVKPPR